MGLFRALGQAKSAGDNNVNQADDVAHILLSLAQLVLQYTECAQKTAAAATTTATT